MITYPLGVPSVGKFAQFSLTTQNAVAYSQSPFTFAGQSHAYAGQMWQLDATLRPMKRSEAEPWIAFLTSLRGQLGTFLIGDPLACRSRGLASTFLGTPVITDQSGGTISVTGASANKTGWLLAGDYIQIGTGSAATLHKLLQDASTDASGDVDLDIWPHIRGTRSGAIAASDTVGNFRLSGNSITRPSDNRGIYSISFSAMEAI